MRRLIRRLFTHLHHNALPCLKEDILTHTVMRSQAARLCRAERYKSLQTRLRTRLYEQDNLLDSLPPEQCYLVEVVMTGDKSLQEPRNLSIAVYHLGDTPTWTPYRPNERTWQDGRFFFALHEGRLNRAGIEFADSIIIPGKRPVMVYRPQWVNELRVSSQLSGYDRLLGARY